MKFVLDDIMRFTNDQKIKINEDKSKIMVSNPSRKLQFPPEIGFPGKENLEYVRKFKMSGLI